MSGTIIYIIKLDHYYQPCVNYFEIDTPSHGGKTTEKNSSCWLSLSKNKNGTTYYIHIYVTSRNCVAACTRHTTITLVAATLLFSSCWKIFYLKWQCQSMCVCTVTKSMYVVYTRGLSDWRDSIS